jgi:hypothetical protein
MNTTPDESFTPLTRRVLSASDRPDFRVTVVPQANAQSLAALGQIGSGSAMPQASTNEPRVTLQRDGERVSAIRIQCACGRIIELACVYEDSSPPASAPPSAAKAAPDTAQK